MVGARAQRGVPTVELLLKAICGFALLAVALGGAFAAALGVKFSLAAGIIVGCAGARRKEHRGSSEH